MYVHVDVGRLIRRGSSGLEALRVVRTMMGEFDGAEALDLFVVRPACLATGALLAGPIGVMIGKGAADVAFYGALTAAASAA